MKAIKLMILGALLILLGPIMSAIDVNWNGFHLLCWIFGIPVFLVGLAMPAGGFKTPKQNEELPQRQCPSCGKSHDFDYPQCPYCSHDYQAKQIK